MSDAEVTRYDVGPDMAVVHRPLGRTGKGPEAWEFEHVCHRVRDGLTIRIAPALQTQEGRHRIVATDPLTVTPSILCSDCGVHGFVTDGRWNGV